MVSRERLYDVVGTGDAASMREVAKWLATSSLCPDQRSQRLFGYGTLWIFAFTSNANEGMPKRGGVPKR